MTTSERIQMIKDLSAKKERLSDRERVFAFAFTVACVVGIVVSLLMV